MCSSENVCPGVDNCAGSVTVLTSSVGQCCGCACAWLRGRVLLCLRVCVCEDICEQMTTLV